MEHLVDGQTHHVAVDRRHAVEIPVLGVLADDLVELVAMLQDTTDQTVGEQAGGALVGAGGRQFDPLAPGRAPRFEVVAHPLGVPELVESRPEILRRIQVVLKEKLHRSFAGLPALAHGPTIDQSPPGQERFIDRSRRDPRRCARDRRTR